MQGRPGGPNPLYRILSYTCALDFFIEQKTLNTYQAVDISNHASSEYRQKVTFVRCDLVVVVVQGRSLLFVCLLR